MTVKDKIFKLNKQFQISYYDTRHDFFSYVAPDMINQIKTFLTTTINEQHPLRNRVSNHIELLDEQLEDLKEISENKSANEWVKDKFLNGVKRNVTEVLWGFRHQIWNFDENILNQVI